MPCVSLSEMPAARLGRRSRATVSRPQDAPRWSLRLRLGLSQRLALLLALLRPAPVHAAAPVVPQSEAVGHSLPQPAPAALRAAAPSAAAGATHLVAGSEAMLADALASAGWQRVVPLCLPWGAPQQLLAAQDADFVWERFNTQTLLLDYVLAWRAASPAAAPQWWLQPRQRELLPGLAEEARVSFDPAAALSYDLGRGLAQIQRGSPLRVHLHHAPQDIDALMRAPAWSLCTAAGATDDPACAPTPLLPPILPELRPVPEDLVWRVNRATDCVALTFDACSTFEHGAYNPEVIRVLKEQHIDATLFIGGHWAEMHPQLLQALAAEPQFELGNHTYSHPHMHWLSPERQRQEILWTQYRIFALTGVVPRYFRPPYGDIDMALIETVAGLGLVTVEYDVPAGDATLSVSATRIADWVGSRASAGSVVIMHMNQPRSNTAQALPQIASRLRARGLRLCKVSETLGEIPAVPEIYP